MSYHQIIYNRLRQHGLTEAGALGVLGNFECESNCEPYRLQGDFSAYRTASKAYVAGVTNGSISRQAFSTDAKGFGIYQLTFWSRKQGYYDYWKLSGKALDDAELQVDYAIKEMPSEAPGLLEYLKTTTDVYAACGKVCTQFERPAVNNIDARYSAALRIKAEIDLDGWNNEGSSSEIPNSSQTAEPAGSHNAHDSEKDAQSDSTAAVGHSLNLRTIDKNCSGWEEVKLLTAALECRGYYETENAPVWDDELTEAVKQLQSDNGLTADGIVGPATWAKLLGK